VEVFRLFGTISINKAKAIADLGAVNAAGAKTSTKLSKALTKIGKVGKAIFAGLAIAAGVVFVSAIKKAAEFELGMAKVKAITGANADEFAALTEKAKELGLETAQTMTDIAAGMEALGRAGFDADEIISAMGGVVALAESQTMELAKAAEITANMIRQMGLEASDADRVVNLLAAAASSSNTTVESLGESMKFFGPIAHAMGMSLEAAVASVAKLGDAGLKGGIATRALQTALQGLAKPTDEAADLMKKLGIDMFDANGEFVGMEGAIGQIEVAFADLTQEQQLASMATIFGTGAVKQFANLLGVGSEELERYTEEITGTTVAFDQQAAMLDTLKGQWQILKGSMELLLVTIGTDMLPILQDLLQERIIPLVNGITNWIKEMGGITGVWSAFMGILEENKVLLGVIGTGIAAIVIALNPIPVAIAAVTAAIALLIAKWDVVKQFLSDVVTGFFEWGRSVDSSIINGLSSAWNTVVDWFKGAWDGLINALTSWMPPFLKTWLGIGEDSGKAYADGLESQKSKAVDAAENVAGAAIEAIAMTVDEAKTAGEDMVSAFAGALTDTTDDAEDAALGVSEAVTDALETSIDIAGSLGENAGESFNDGLFSFESDVFDTGITLGAAAEDGIRDRLGMQSPSAVMFDAGVDAGTGFKEGMEDTVPEIVEVVEDLGDEIEEVSLTFFERIFDLTREAWEEMGEETFDATQDIADTISESWEDAKDATKNALGDMLNAVVDHYQDEEDETKDHTESVWDILKDGVRNFLVSLRETLFLKAASHLVDAFALAFIPGMQAVAGGHLVAAGIYAAGGAGLAIAGFEEGAVFDQPTLLPPHMVAEGGVSEAYLPLSPRVFGNIGQGIVDALSVPTATPALAGAGGFGDSIQVDMRGLYDGATINVRDDQDISRLAEETHSLWRSRMRGIGRNV